MILEPKTKSLAKTNLRGRVCEGDEAWIEWFVSVARLVRAPLIGERLGFGSVQAGGAAQGESTKRFEGRKARLAAICYRP